MSIVFNGGTAAELIKLFPIIRLAERDGARWAALFTGQSPVSFMAQWDDFGLPRSRCVALVERQEDLARAADAAVWFAQACAVRKRRLRERIESVVPFKPRMPFIVHGDTLSTLIGAIHGKRLGCEVGHVEAGIRSRKLREPFPEEFNRTVVGQIATLHFASEPICEENLKRDHARGRIIATGGNTQLDAIDAALEMPTPDGMFEGKYGLVNIHRFETLISEERKAKVKATLLRASAKHRLVMVAHETTSNWLRGEKSFTRDFEANGAIWLPRQPFLRFAHWLARAEFVIADSGGNQQECTYLGIPCLLLRMLLEVPASRPNVVLSKFEDDVTDAFIADPAKYREPKQLLATSPASVIWNECRPLA